MPQINKTKIGEKYGKLLVIAFSHKNKRGEKYYLCRCECGNEKIIRGSNLRYGKTKSCGCLNSDDLTGCKFGRLLVLSFLHTDKYNNKCYLCKCDCGREKVVRGVSMKNGLTNSCGCLLKDKVTKHGKYKSCLYTIFNNMNSRCNNKNNLAYKNYGGRGIKCLWKSCDDFEKDMHESYLEHVKQHGEKQTTLDRIDVNKNYSKENCRWATYKEQANNKRNNINIVYKEEDMTLMEYSEKIGINYSTLNSRINKLKWSLDKAINI